MTETLPTLPAPTRRAVLALAGGLAAVPALSGRGHAQTAAASKRVVVAMPNPSQFATLEPIREYSNVSFRVGYNLYDNLIAVDFLNGFALKPALATSWSRTSPTTLDFTLRDGVKFHDGSTLTAEDVAFSFGPERMSDPKAPGWALTRPFLGTVAKVDAIGSMAVRVTTKGPDPLIEKRLAGWMGQIISKRAYLAAPSFAAWEKAPVGTGPFKVKDYAHDEHVILTAHDDYFGGRPTIDELAFQVVPELASRVNMMATGEADIVTELAPDQIKTIQGQAGREVVGGAIMNIRVIVYDKTNPVLADPRVRQALSLAIDRKLIVDTLYEGHTTVTRGHQHESYGPLYLADYVPPSYDPDAARALLKAAGYIGAPINYRLLNNYYALQVQTAQAMVEMWRAVGLNVQIQMQENFTQVLAPEGRGIYDSSDTLFWQDPVGGLVRRYGPASGVQAQYHAWSNDAFNALCPILESSLDTAQRIDADRKMMTIYDETDPAGTTLHLLPMLYGKKQSLRWKAYPAEFMDFRAANMA